MKNKLNLFYIRCLIRTLKEFKEYNAKNRNKIFRLIESGNFMEEAPHVIGENFFLLINSIDKKKRYDLMEYYISLISERFINDLKLLLLKSNNKNYENIDDDVFLKKLKSFQIFSFLRKEFNMTVPSESDYLNFFYYG